MSRVVEVDLRHALRFARNLDPLLAERALAEGVDVRRHMASVVRSSRVVRGLEIEGELVAMGGVGGVLLGPATVWLALGASARRHKKSLVIEARKELAKVLLNDGTVTALVASDDPTGRRFAGFLGFRLVAMPTPDWVLMAVSSTSEDA